MKKNSGIYCIINRVNQKIYIGSAKNLKDREKQHFSLLKNNKHVNKYLQNSYNKHGYENFEFKILCYCNKNQLKDRERFYMNFYNSTNLLCGYNIALNTIAPMKGRHHSQEAKKKIGDAQKGEKNHNYGKITPQAVKEKLSQANLGRIKTEDEKRKLSQANKGKKPSLRAIEASRKAVYFTRYKNFVSEWQKLNKQGVTYRKISKMFNVGEKTVSLYIKHFSTISISPPV